MSDTGLLLPDSPVSCDWVQHLKAPLSLDCCEAWSATSTAPADSDDDRPQSIPSWADDSDDDVSVEQEKTTLMLRNVPYSCSRDELIDFMDSKGYRGKYDFVYLPADFRSKSGFGYAFINLVSHRAAQSFQADFDGFCSWRQSSQKVAEVGWSEPNQGLAVHIERYRNSPVMHDGVPDEFKPALFKDGNRIAFPSATRAIRAPRIKRR